LRTALTILLVFVPGVLSGCVSGEKAEPVKGKELLTVNFEQGRTLQYRFVSKRDITVDMDPAKKFSRGGKGALDKFTESMELVVAYTPIEVNPHGLTTIKATCKSVRVTRSKSSGGRDAVEYLAGKTFTFTVWPNGKIEDYSQLDELLKQIGEKAFRANTDRGRIKVPDMICDVTATQWFLWDSLSSIEIGKALEGLAVGDSWKSQLLVQGPMVMRQARDVTYTLKEIRNTGNERLAVIGGTYTAARSVPRSWPIPYSGRFQMSGTFGFLSGYRLLSLEGQGEELFNIDAGRTEQYNQQYQTQIQASILMGIGSKPLITIKQNITMKLIK